MRFALTLATMIAMMVVTDSIGWSDETPTPVTKPAKPWLVRRLSNADIRNPIIQRIDALTWEDEAMKKQLALLPAKTRAKIASASEDQQRGYLNRARNQIKLKYVDEGGAVLPIAKEPTPWIHAGPQPIVSLGVMPCYNNMDQAKAIAKETGEPILVIYTELPGCSACVGHGHNQLSHPFVVDAAMEFVPVVVSGGWPHLWVLDPDGKPISERVNHQTSIGDTLKMMRNALRTSKREVPAWLDLVTDEYTAKRETTAFAMGCFWSGERQLGKLDGVLSTRVGNRQKKGEWVEVEFDPTVVSYEELVKTASEMRCTSAIVARTDEQAEIAKDYVSNPDRLYRDDESRINPVRPGNEKRSLVGNMRYANLPLTPCQATRLNALMKNAEKYLSPSQVIVMQKLEKLKADGAKVGDLGLEPDWTSLDNFDQNARDLQTKLGLCPKRI